MTVIHHTTSSHSHSSIIPALSSSTSLSEASSSANSFASSTTTTTTPASSSRLQRRHYEDTTKRSSLSSWSFPSMSLIFLCTACIMTVISLLTVSNSLGYFTTTMLTSSKMANINDNNGLLSFESSSSPSTSSLRSSRSSSSIGVGTTTAMGTEEKPFCSLIHSNNADGAVNLDPKHDYRIGQWVYDESRLAQFPYLGGIDDIWGPYCTKLEQEYLKTGIIPDYLKYTWQPTNCQVLKFDKDTFCNVIANQTIGVIGDSISQQFVHSIIGLTRGKLIDDPNFLQPPTWNNKQSIPLCVDNDNEDDTGSEPSPNKKNTAQVVFLRHNKYVANDTASHQALQEIVNLSDYLVMNWGVHYQPWNDMEVAVDEFLSVLQNTWTVENRKDPNRLFWRTTIVAHSNCSTAIVPDETSDANGGFNIHNNPKYNTDEILLQDVEIVQRKLRDLNSNNDRSSNGSTSTNSGLNVTILDVTSSTMLRRDGHRVIGHKGTEDCLHYCEPGPIDSWVDLFYHHVITMNANSKNSKKQ